MEKWEYGYLYHTDSVYPFTPDGRGYDAVGPAEYWAFLELTSGQTAARFDRFVAVLDKLGSDGWIIGEGRPLTLITYPKALPVWCKEELLLRRLGIESGVGWAHMLRRRNDG